MSSSSDEAKLVSSREEEAGDIVGGVFTFNLLEKTRTTEFSEAGLLGVAVSLEAKKRVFVPKKNSARFGVCVVDSEEDAGDVVAIRAFCPICCAT